MGVKIFFINKKNYKGEKIADIRVESPNTLKGINCPKKLNSGAIDEFLIIFLVAKAKGISYFKDIAEQSKRKSQTKMGRKNFKQNGNKNDFIK